MAELLDWAEYSDLHMLIRSCVFHYELELIHPFTDGNGRIGRLWHTLLLSKWKPDFAWLPVESIIFENQRNYYAAINASNDAADSTIFIEFMLSAIKAALIEVMDVSDVMIDVDKATDRWGKIAAYLDTHSFLMNRDVQALCHVSSATANRILGQLVDEGKLVRYHEGRYWAYRCS